MILKIQDWQPLLGTFLPNIYFATDIKSVLDYEDLFEFTKTAIPPAVFMNGEYILSIRNVVYTNDHGYNEKEEYGVDHYLTDGINEIAVEYNNHEQEQYLRAVQKRRDLDELLSGEEDEEPIEHNERFEISQERDAALALEQRLYGDNEQRGHLNVKKFPTSGTRFDYAIIIVNEESANLIGWEATRPQRKPQKHFLERLVPAYNPDF